MLTRYVMKVIQLYPSQRNILFLIMKLNKIAI